MGPPGRFHDEETHQSYVEPHQDTDTIRQQDVVEFQNWMNEDRPLYNKVRPWYTLEYDRDQKYMQRRVFSLWTLVLFFSAIILSKVYDRERARLH